MNNTIKDGVAVRNNTLEFDFTRDWYDDVIVFFEPTANNNVFTMRGVTVFFGHKLTTPETSNKKEASEGRNLLRTFIKNYDKLSVSDKQNVMRLINESIQQLNQHTPLNSFDMVVSVESTAPLNKLLISLIKPHLRNDAMIVDNLFVKNNIQNIDLDWEMLDKEPSEKTKEMVLTMYEKILKNKQLFFIKDLKSSVRRYFIKFLKFSDITQQSTFDHIFSKNVLLVDDTVGEVATFKDMIRLLTTYKPKSTFCYAFLKDY